MAFLRPLKTKAIFSLIKPVSCGEKRFLILVVFCQGTAVFPRYPEGKFDTPSGRFLKQSNSEAEIVRVLFIESKPFPGSPPFIALCATQEFPLYLHLTLCAFTVEPGISRTPQCLFQSVLLELQCLSFLLLTLPDLLQGNPALARSRAAKS